MSISMLVFIFAVHTWLSVVKVAFHEIWLYKCSKFIIRHCLYTDFFSPLQLTPECKWFYSTSRALLLNVPAPSPGVVQEQKSKVSKRSKVLPAHQRPESGGGASRQQSGTGGLQARRQTGRRVPAHRQQSPSPSRWTSSSSSSKQRSLPPSGRRGLWRLSMPPAPPLPSLLLLPTWGALQPRPPSTCLRGAICWARPPPTVLAHHTTPELRRGAPPVSS